MSHCPLCGKQEFTFEQRAKERCHEVQCTHCNRFVIEDQWLRYLQTQPPPHELLEEFRQLTRTSATMGFVFNICDRVLGRAPLP